MKKKESKKNARKSVRKTAMRKQPKQKREKKERKDYGEAPERVPTYEPIKNFNPANPPEDFILVKMDHELLDDMLEDLTKNKRACAIAVPCRKVK